MNNLLIPSNLVADIQEVSESAHLLEQAQDQGDAKLTLELLSRFKESIEEILYEITDLFECQEQLSTEGLYNE
jgi:hypothetical protein